MSQLPLEDLDAAIRRERSRGFARVQFLANLDYVKRHLEAGFTKRAVWRQLHQHGQFDAAYQQFLAYVAKHVTPQKARPKASSLPPPTTKPVLSTRPTTSPPSPEKPTFKFDPFKPDILKVSSRTDTPSASQKAP